MKPKFANFPAKTQANGQIRGMGLKAKEFGSGLGQRHFARPQVYVYDEKGQLTEVKLAAHTATPVSTKYGYDEVGAKTSQTDANNHITKWQFDSRGREVKRRLPMGLQRTPVFSNLKFQRP